MFGKQLFFKITIQAEPLLNEGLNAFAEKLLSVIANQTITCFGFSKAKMPSCGSDPRLLEA
jgi:hypothetical protein